MPCFFARKKLINIYCYYMGISKEQKILIKTRDYTEVEYYKEIIKN